MTTPSTSPVPSSTPNPTTPSTPTTPKAQDCAAKRDWPGYFKAVEGKPPRETLLKALELIEKEWDAAKSRPANPFAIDLGCGSGRDTFELLRRGWNVLAIDATPMAIDLLLRDTPAQRRPQLQTRVKPFETVTLPRADLLNASYSIPFCDPGAFPRLWEQVMEAIPVGGRFAGQFFGPRDDWAQLSDRSHMSRGEVNTLLRHFTLENFQEVENREAGVTGEVKNWHIFHVVAKRRV